MKSLVSNVGSIFNAFMTKKRWGYINIDIISFDPWPLLAVLYSMLNTVILSVAITFIGRLYAK